MKLIWNALSCHSIYRKMFIFLVDNSPLGFLFYLIIPRSIQVPESFPVVIVIIIIIDFQLCCEINTFALLQRHLGCVNIFAWVQKRKRRGEFSEKTGGGVQREKGSQIISGSLSFLWNQWTNRFYSSLKYSNPLPIQLDSVERIDQVFLIYTLIMATEHRFDWLITWSMIHYHLSYLLL